MIYFQDANCLYVTKELLSISNVLNARLQPASGKKQPHATLHLLDISLEAGHVLVHFLWTGQYECLRSRESSTADKHVSEFNTALRLLAAAKSFDLSDFEELAAAEMERVGGELTVLSLIDYVDKSSPKLDYSYKTAQYIENRVESFITHVYISSANDILAELETTNSICQLVLKSSVKSRLAELAREAAQQEVEETVSIIEPVNDIDQTKPLGDYDALCLNQSNRTGVPYNGPYTNQHTLEEELDGEPLPEAVPDNLPKTDHSKKETAHEAWASLGDFDASPQTYEIAKPVFPESHSKLFFQTLSLIYLKVARILTIEIVDQQDEKLLKSRLKKKKKKVANSKGEEQQHLKHGNVSDLSTPTSNSPINLGGW